MAKSAPGARISAFFCSGFSPSQGWVLIGAAAAAAFDPAKIAALRAVFHAGNSSCCAAALQFFCCNPAPSGTLSKKQLAAGAALRVMCSCSRFLRCLWALLPFLLLLMHLRNACTGAAAGFAMPSCSRRAVCRTHESAERGARCNEKMKAPPASASQSARSAVQRHLGPDEANSLDKTERIRAFGPRT